MQPLLSMRALLLLGLALTPATFGQTLAFPGALGFGAWATGGRGGAVYHVTTLADSGPGSFRDAVSGPNRIIVFDVGGYVNLLTAVQACSSLTIAGQTAPGGGIGLMGAEVSFYGQTNIICRHLRFRQGDVHNATNPRNPHQSALNLGSKKGSPMAGNMIFDHVSVEFASWDNIDAVNTENLTVQWSIIADPIKLQQFGAHTEGKNLSWINNLWVNEHNRQPLAKADTVYVNNVVYNYQLGYTCGNTAGHFSHDIVNNYFIPGPSTSNPGNDFFQIGDRQTVFATGNLRAGAGGILDGGETSPAKAGPVLKSPWSQVTPGLPTVSAAASYWMDVYGAGALPRDEVDQQVVSDVLSLGRVGKLLVSQADTGLENSGYGTIASGSASGETNNEAPPAYWKKAFGPKPSTDGYTLLEQYLNWLAELHAVGPSGHALEINLSHYALISATARRVFAAFAATHGSVNLLPDGATARFVPATGFSGMAGFKFSLRSAEGVTWTNTLAILITAQDK